MGDEQLLKDLFDGRLIRKKEHTMPDLPVLFNESCKLGDLPGTDIIPEPGIVRVQERSFTTEGYSLKLVRRPLKSSLKLPPFLTIG